MSTTNALPGCDTHDMVVVHRVFRREFALLPRMVRAVPDGDVARAAVIATHAREMTSLLHHHHTAEDEMVWPVLRERATLDLWLVERMETQHEAVDGLLGGLDEGIARFAGTAGPTERRELASLLDRLSDALVEHLDEEEASILPVVAQTLTVAEWEELARRGMAAMRKPRLLVILGHILEDADPDERAAFLAHVPAPARLGYRLVGRRRHRRETATQRRGLG
ncbi:hemerythrin domain-containing protein [Nocardioides cynanchi]|uniref:hemerythrin domain-containing protein n=1 Tax=Nocardioides cynanchi TaxID=2558918 RepID=UPI00192E0F70|nr:hemerythrin domain-containing protein [Nocardioides cynanchi]